MQGPGTIPHRPHEPQELSISVSRYQAEAMKLLRETTPLNDRGMPEGIYNIDLVWSSPNPEDPTPEALELLSYDDGYPVIKSTGMPLWDRIPGEPPRFHGFFLQYLKMGEGRHLNDLPVEISQIDSEPPNLPTLRDLAEIYNWHFRALAHDHFYVAVREAQRTQNIRLTEESHLQLANELAGKCATWINDHFKDLKEETVVNLLKMSIALQRISLGLPASGPKETNGKGGSSGSTLIQTIIQQNNGGTTVVSLERALKDPETADLAQRLALKIQPQTAQKIREASGVEDAEIIIENKGNI